MEKGDYANFIATVDAALLFKFEKIVSQQKKKFV
jgi:hypothetical protein